MTTIRKPLPDAVRCRAMVLKGRYPWRCSRHRMIGCDYCKQHAKYDRKESTR